MKTLSRRTCLRGAGGVAIGLPLLGAMLPRRSSAAEPPLRFIATYTFNGLPPGAWGASGTETDFTLNEALQPFERIKKDIVVIAGLDQTGGGGDAHGNAIFGCLTGAPVLDFRLNQNGGTGSSISIDQLIANQIGGSSKFTSIGVGVGPVGATPIFAGPRQMMPLESNPVKLFARLFADFSGVDSQAQIERTRARRRSILDAVMAEYKTVSERVGGDDRQRLDGHLAALREIETGLDRIAEPNACQVPEAPTARYTAPDSIPAVGKAQMDMLAVALTCGLTRVATLGWYTGAMVCSWLGHTRDHHSLAHEDGTTGKPAIMQLQKWFHEQTTYFIEKLKSTPEPASGGSVLDNCLLLRLSDMAVGGHPLDNAPYLLAGRAGGRLKTGRFLSIPGPKLVPHNNLLLSIAQLFGVVTTSFGKPEWCTGPLPGLLA